MTRSRGMRLEIIYFGLTFVHDVVMHPELYGARYRTLTCVRQEEIKHKQREIKGEEKREGDYKRGETQAKVLLQYSRATPNSVGLGNVVRGQIV